MLKPSHLSNGYRLSCSGKQFCGCHEWSDSPGRCFKREFMVSAQGKVINEQENRRLVTNEPVDLRNKRLTFKNSGELPVHFEGFTEESSILLIKKN